MAKSGHAIVAGVSWLLLMQAVHACGDSEDSGNEGTAGIAGSAEDGGAAAGSGARSGAGRSGASGTPATSRAGGAPSAGRGSGSGGGGGRAMGSSGMNGSGSSVGLDDVDLTLGGLNQDLPAPARDCLDMPTYEVGCMSVTGEYNGEPFAFECIENMGPIQVAYVSVDNSRQIGCPLWYAAEDDMRVALVLGPRLFKTPRSTFEVQADPLSFVGVYRMARDLSTHDGDGFELADTHTAEAKIAGEVFLGPGRSAGDVSEFSRGVFALSLTPLSSCAPDAEEFGCDTLRLRASYGARTFPVITILTEGQSCAEFPGRSRCGEGLECVVESGQERGVCSPR